jgi:hypothetical protein
VTTNILREAVVSIPHAGATKKYLDKTKLPFSFVRTKLPWGSRVSILSVAIAVRSAIAEYRLVIAIHRRKKALPIKSA